ncbi:unnamed protein product [Peniophora sp. CBMAI 1063]|nr:unnamed protein product [Peniophora sp. CBMAI 1063]
MPLASSVSIGGAIVSSCHIHSLDDDCLIAIFYDVIRCPPRRWRAIVLDLAELWAQVVFAYPKAFHTLLGRARECPLKGAAKTQSGQLSDEQVAYMLSHPERLRVLALPSEIRPSIALAFAGLSLPVLQKLVIDFSSHWDDTFGEGEPYNDFHYDERALDAPLLRTVTFGNIFIPLVAPRLTSLTLLKDNGSPGGVDPTDICTLLRSAPMLKDIVLESCFSGGDWEMEEGVAPIELPNLLRLLISGHIADIIGVFAAIGHMNESVCVYLTISDIDEDEEESIAELSHALGPCLRPGLHDTLSVSGFDTGATQGEPFLKLTSSERDVGPLFSPYTLAIEVKESLIDVMMRLYLGIFKQLPEGQIRHLSVCHQDRYNAFTWVETLPVFHLPALSQSVETLFYEIEMERLGPMTDVADFGSGLLPKFLLVDPFVYPKLTSITINGDLGGDHYATATTPEDINELITWLKARAACDRPRIVFRLTGDSYKIPFSGESGVVMRPRDWKILEKLDEWVEIVDERTLVAPKE